MKAAPATDSKTLLSSKTITGKATVRGYNPTGNVTWSSLGTDAVSMVNGTTCTLAHSPSAKHWTSGSCSVTFKGIWPGALTVQATYAGDPNNTSSKGTHGLAIAK